MITLRELSREDVPIVTRPPYLGHETTTTTRTAE